MRIPHPAESFDVVVSTQVFEYVDDVAGALDEVRRVLRPAGRVVLLDTDWASVVWRSSDDARMARVLTAFEDHLADPHLPRTLADGLAKSGFMLTHQQVVPILNTGYDNRTYSAGLIDIVSGFVPGHGGVTADEARAWADDLRGLGPATSSASTGIWSSRRRCECRARRAHPGIDAPAGRRSFSRPSVGELAAR